MAYKDLTPRERITAASFDIMRDEEFALLGGATQIGTVTVGDEVPTAGTNGRDTFYNEAFIMGMTRPQLRYLVAHETLHKMLMHCVEYGVVTEKYPGECNQAMDYVVNQMIDDLDVGRGFVARPTDPEPLVNPKYRGMSFLEVLQDLLKEKEKEQQSPQGQKPSGKPTLDQHTQSNKSADGSPTDGREVSPEDIPALQAQMQDAIAQGQLVRERLQAKKHGTSAGNSRVGGFTERRTDWKGPLRRFIQEISEGDDQSRFSPPNKRMMPLGIILPSHFSEAVGEIVIACDTSGSMHGVYPVVFGEVARICQQVRPAKVRILWWDTVIAGDQTFTERDYDKIAKVLKPAGGGGTTVSVVADYIEDKKLKPRAVIYITDGYVEHTYRVPKAPTLWGVVDNTSWVPRKGKKIDINTVTL